MPFKIKFFGSRCNGEQKGDSQERISISVSDCFTWCLDEGPSVCFSVQFWPDDNKAIGKCIIYTGTCNIDTYRADVIYERTTTWNDFVIKAPNQGECFQACLDTPGCVSFTYHNGGSDVNKCILYDIECTPNDVGASADVSTYKVEFESSKTEVCKAFSMIDSKCKLYKNGCVEEN